MTGTESTWRLVVALLALAAFFCLGIAHLIYPERFYKRSGLRKGGRMLTALNLDGIRLIGLILAVVTAGIMYDIVKPLLRR